MFDVSKHNLSSCCDDIVSEYAVSHTDKEPELLKVLDRETNLKTMYPRMMAGHLQGRFLKMITSMICPKNILEIGTFTGYSTLCFAEALSENGKIYTVEINPEYSYISSKYFNDSGLSDKIISITGDALKVIPEIDVNFQMAYIDADKMQLNQYYEIVLGTLDKGGFILIDNMLWSGKVLDVNENHDSDTLRIDALNNYIRDDGRVENVFLPFRDGIMIVRKK